MHKTNNARGVFFGSANDAMKQQKPPADVLPFVDTYMENIATAITTKHAKLHALVESKARLSAITEKTCKNLIPAD